MAADQIQIVAVMPGGGFEALGLIDLQDIDALLACLASLDTRGGHVVSPIDVARAYRAGKATSGNNDHEDDAA